MSKKNKGWTADQVELVLMYIKVHKRLQNEVRLQWNRFRGQPSFHVHRNKSLHGRRFPRRIWS